MGKFAIVFAWWVLKYIGYILCINKWDSFSKLIDMKIIIKNNIKITMKIDMKITIKIGMKIEPIKNLRFHRKDLISEF